MAESDEFEKEVIQHLRKLNHWAIRLPASAGGQPFDILSLSSRAGIPYFIECKVCATDRFDLSRIEPNQLASMDGMEMYGDMYFAIRFKSGVKVLSANCINSALAEGRKSINYDTYDSIKTSQWGW